MSGRKPRGLFSIYLLAILVVMTLFCSLAVDWGRVQVAKVELQRATDAAARAAAAALPDGIANARAEAKRWAALNNVDGQPLLLTDADIVFLKYNTATGKYDINNSTPDTVRILGNRTGDRGTAVPLMWAGIAGPKTINARTKGAARLYPGYSFNQKILATANPFLARMPKNPYSVASLNNPHKSPDYTGRPGYVESGPLSNPTGAGQPFTFDSISGTARHDPNLANYQPDGQTGEDGTPADIGGDTAADKNTHRENGIRDGNIPINALVGVFLTDKAPNDPTINFNDAGYTIDTDKCPTDFSTTEARNRLTYQPALQQVFFIGDGLTSNGAHQTFIAPKGATRLYLATWDFYEWNNNFGERTVQINPTPGKVVTVE